MICTFFGHRDTPDSVKKSLKEAILNLSNTQGVKTFCVGNNGKFDYMVQSVLKEISNNDTSINYLIVLSSLCEKVNCNQIGNTIFPEELDDVPPQFAISKRNEWLIKNSDFTIVYLRNTVTNTYKWVEKSKRKGLKVINLFKQE